MYSYYIKRNGIIEGRVLGRFSAFRFINALLDGKIGLWFNDRCVLKDENTVYTIERANND
jgi:hypothetical protein